MDYRPDISFEYDYIRIVYEVILSNLRTNKKVVEKDLTTIITKLQNMKKKHHNTQEMQSTIRQLITKTEELERKFDQLCKDEEMVYDCLKERITQLQMIDEKHFSFENLKSFCTKKMNNLLLDFFLREKFLDTAKNYIEEEKIFVKPY
jgi:TolA-binding protein